MWARLSASRDHLQAGPRRAERSALCGECLLAAPGPTNAPVQQMAGALAAQLALMCVLVLAGARGGNVNEAMPHGEHKSVQPRMCPHLGQDVHHMAALRLAGDVEPLSNLLAREPVR